MKEVTVKDIEKLQQECKQLEMDIIVSKSKISQLKSGELENETIESLKEKLMRLEVERVDLEEQFSAKRAEYNRAYYTSQKP